MSRVVNTSRNAAFGIVYSVISMFIPFFLRSVLIKTLGDQFLGINNLFHSILSFLCIVDFGFSGAIAYSMYKPIAENDYEKVSCLLNLYRKIYVAIGALILAGGLCALPFLKGLINGEYPKSIQIHIVYLIYLSEVVLNYCFLGHYSSLLSALQRSDIISKVYSVTNIVSYILRIIVLLFFKDYYLYILFLPLVVIVERVIIFIICRKKYPQYVCKGNVTKADKEKIMKKTLSLSISSIGSRVENSIGTLFISKYFGLTSVAIYSNYFYIVSSLQSLLATIITSAQASIGNSTATQSREKNYIIFSELNYINMWIITWMSVCMLCLYQHFMKLWMGEKLMSSNLFVVIIIVYFYVSCSRYPIEVTKNALGLWEKDKYKTFFGATVLFVVNSLLIRRFGIISPVAALIASILFVERPWENLFLFNNYFVGKLKKYYICQFQYIAIIIISSLISLLICKYITLSNYLGFFVKGIFSFLVSNIIFILCTHRKEEFINCFNYINRLLKK